MRNICWGQYSMKGDKQNKPKGNKIHTTPVKQRLSIKEFQVEQTNQSPRHPASSWSDFSFSRFSKCFEISTETSSCWSGVTGRVAKMASWAQTSSSCFHKNPVGYTGSGEASGWDTQHQRQNQLVCVRNEAWKVRAELLGLLQSYFTTLLRDR